MYSELAARPLWQRRTRQRFAASSALAATLIAAFIGLVKFADTNEPARDIEVSLLPAEPERIIDPRGPLLPIELPQPVVREEVRVVPIRESTAGPAEPELTDWYANMQDVVASKQSPASVNPAFDARRREAAVKFAPSRAPAKKPIWDNVETDQIGRTVLVHGDCHRVIEDPRVTRRDAFETFYQFLTVCGKFESAPGELPWVDEVREQYAYLTHDPDSGDSYQFPRDGVSVADLHTGKLVTVPNFMVTVPNFMPSFVPELIPR